MLSADCVSGCPCRWRCWRLWRATLAAGRPWSCCCSRAAAGQGAGRRGRHCCGRRSRRYGNTWTGAPRFWGNGRQVVTSVLLQRLVFRGGK